jgi:hypothetical protein
MSETDQVPFTRPDEPRVARSLPSGEREAR